MPSFLRYFTLLALPLLVACSTVVEGASQKITVHSSPQGAQCLVQQAGDVVGRMTTPGTVEVGKSKNDLVITCSKPGYETVSLKNRSDLAITSFGNMAFYQLSFLGDAVDSATGASNKYDSKVMVKLAPAAIPTAFPPPPGIAPALQLPVETVAMLSIQAPMPLPATPGPLSSAASSVAPAAAETPIVLSESNPSLKASEALGKAALKSAMGRQVTQLSYAEQLDQAPRRPPFDIIQ